MPGYQPVTNPSVLSTSTATPTRCLDGTAMGFVTLEAAAFEEMHEWDILAAEAFPLQMLGQRRQSSRCIDFLSLRIALAAGCQD